MYIPVKCSSKPEAVRGVVVCCQYEGLMSLEEEGKIEY